MESTQPPGAHTPSGGDCPALPATLAELAAKVHTINPDTGLSTDFLNQYNELSMLLDLAADEPDMLEEVAGWSPRSYHDHFAASGFKEWALVVQAHDLCPPAIRAQFDEAIEVLNSVATCGLRALLEMAEAGRAANDTAAGQDFATMVRSLAAELQAAIVHASGLINGRNTLGSQAQVDTLFARAQAEFGEANSPLRTSATPDGSANADSGTESAGTTASAPAAADDEMLDQHAIDALFD